MIGLLFEYGANLYDSILEIWFVTNFCGHRVRDNKQSYLAMLILFIAQCLLNKFAYSSLILSVIVPWILVFGYSLTLSKTTLIKRLLSPTVFLLCIVLLNTLVLYSTTWLLNTDIADLWLVSSINRYIYLIIAKIVLTVAIVIIEKIVDVDYSFSLMDMVLYFVSPMVTMVVLYMFMNMSVRFDISEYNTLIIAVTVALLSINVIMLILFHRAMQNTSAKHELELLNSRSELEEKRYGEIGNMYKQLQITRHDLKDHLIYIDNLIAEKRYDEVEKYISDRREELESTRSVRHTGNRVLDYIINSKLDEAGNIPFVITGELRELRGIDDLDVASLFGNILDNAIEATKNAPDPAITLEFSVTGNYQNILCKNTISRSVLKDNPDLNTTKNDRRRHGYGIQSIRRIVSKHGGMVEFYEEDGMFCVHIALNC